jgi:hypothetical protein
MLTAVVKSHLNVPHAPEKATAGKLNQERQEMKNELPEKR